MIPSPPVPSRMLFIRSVRRPTGGNIKVRDYFTHAAAHPGIDATIWFPPCSNHQSNDIWAELPADRLATTPTMDGIRFVCINGKDWSLLPDDTAAAEIIHFVQHPGYLADPVLRGYLERPARRICTTPALADQIAPVANGPIHVVPIGIDPACFAPRHPCKRHRITILAAKQPEFAARLDEQLRARGHEPELLDGRWRPHAEQVGIIRATDVLVALPSRVEGFYLPALEGMAAGCIVVCSDVAGTHGHCIAQETCLQPPFGDLDAHVGAVLCAIEDQDLRARLVRNGRKMASGHGMPAERRAFHAVLDLILSASGDKRRGGAEKSMLGVRAGREAPTQRALP
ncbi:glycosyltransferase family 4 protein [Sphingomonas alpina]|uniref:Glycosyltransferase family 4 protein n=1 Tax=Sphingomonas alpina TaxID=653931 RepID=A0A7H0LGJ4_9SPHN|nr:glycosyltransferase family 4 protein [Sphingomonas alpina]QNQ08797.1 glycosyltransferase family 4 protein [Sphingomonas alpina]